MEVLLWILAAVGGSVVLYWAISLIIGVFGPKTQIGARYLKRRLRQLNVDPRTLGDDVLHEFARNALSVATWSGHEIGKYDATEYKEHLEWHAELIRAWVRKEKLDVDSEKLVTMLINRANSRKGHQT